MPVVGRTAELAQIDGPQNGKVAIAAAPGGHLWVLWYDFQANFIHAVRTNASATSFGAVMTIKPPAHLFVALAAPNGSSSPACYDAQILPPLTLLAVKAKVGVPGTATFTVTDAGTPVSGAAVTFLGAKRLTNASGTASFPVKKGTAAGKHSAASSKPGYTAATVVIDVT
jgi:hypothetical protein